MPGRSTWTRRMACGSSGGGRGEGLSQEEREGRHRQREETLAVKGKEEVDAIKVCGERGYQGMGVAINVRLCVAIYC